MKKFVALSGFVSVGLFLSANPILAQSFTITNGQTNTSAQTLNATQSGTINSGGTLKVGGSSVAITVKGNATITNNGTINQNGSARAIRDNTGGLTLNVTNTGTIETSGADTFQMNVAGSSVSLTNSGTIESLGTGGSNGQAIDWAALNTNTGTNTLHNNAGGVITAADSDAVRPGQNGVLTNDGTIKSMTPTPATNNDGNDGIDLQNNTNVTITNANANLAANANLIEGARHGITGGDVNANITLSVTNNSHGTIKGDDGSGINIDGFANSSGVTTEMVTIQNAGLIQGNGVTGDGDGVDVDGVVNITNTGTILSKNAVGTSSAHEKSEGVTVGGGTIVNSGTIEGDVTAGNTLAVGRGITLAGVDKDTNGNAIPTQAIYADSTITNNSGGKIIGQTDAGIAIEGNGPTGSVVHTVSIANNAGATIQGGGTAVAAIEAGVTAFNSTATANNLAITNSGTIDGSSSGKAIDFGSGSNSLTVTGGSASILGNIAGGTGTNTVTIDPGVGNTFSYAGVMSNISSVEDKSGTVILTGANIYTGNTTISGGTTYVNNTTGSGTGAGKIAVSTGAAFGGSGIIQSGSGNGITLAGGSTLISGGIQSGTTAGHGLTLDNTVAQGTILDASIGSANLTFYLGAGTTSGAGPNKNSSYATVLGDIANELKFATGDTVTLTDLTSGNLQLSLNIPYLLIQAASNADYSGLTTTGGVMDGVAQNGYVTNLTLLGNTPSEYAGTELYLFNGKLEAETVPEPSSWLLACLAAVVFVQIRRRQLKS